MVKRVHRNVFEDQKLPQAPVSTADLTGKVVVVIGANTGLGYETAKHMASMNPAKLILGCRSKERGEAALKKLTEETSFNNAEMWLIDLGDFASVKAFADKFDKEVDRLDFLIENAAVALQDTYDTPDGWEASLQVNNLGPELLTLLLLPKMLDTAKKSPTLPRLVVVSSGIHFEVTIDENVKNIHKHLNEAYRSEKAASQRYCVAKLVNVFFVRALQSKLPVSGPSVIANAISPGFCITELRRNVTDEALLKQFEMLDKIAFTNEQGSRHIVWGAVAELGVPEKEEQLKGAYLYNSTIDLPSDFVLSAQGAKIQGRIWDEMVDILTKVDPRVSTIVEKYLKLKVYSTWHPGVPAPETHTLGAARRKADI